MRGWNIVVGGLAVVVGSALWAVSLGTYQWIVESVRWVDAAGVTRQAYAETWPREVRGFSIMLAIFGLIVIGSAAKRSVVAAVVLGLAWLGADLSLDRADVAGRPATVVLALAGVVVVGVIAAVTATIPSGHARQVAVNYCCFGIAIFLGVACYLIDDDHTEGAATSIIRTVLAAGFQVVAVALIAPALATRWSRWAVPAAAVLSSLPLVWLNSQTAPVAAVLVAVPVVVISMAIGAAALGAPIIRAVGAGAAAIVVPLILAVPLAFVVLLLGSALTSLAGNPPVDGADGDAALALPTLLIGLATAAVSYAVSLAGRRREGPTLIPEMA